MYDKDPLPTAYPITDVQLSGLTHKEQVVRLSYGGATFIQLREKQLSPSQFWDQAIEATDLARSLGVRLIINDRCDIALAAGADGVHLGQDDLPPEAARRILGPRSIIGYSTHTIEQVRFALEQPIDYLAFGPIFQTATKADTEPVVGLEALRSVAGIARNIPIVAIGGITAENARAVIEAGASSVAIIGGLIADSGRISERTRALISALQS